MQTRIGAVAELYDVISRSATLGPVPVGPYLGGIAESLKSSLLGDAAGITPGLGSRFIGAFVRQLGAALATATGDKGTTFSVRLAEKHPC